jgi:putative acetyltransferase
MSLDPTQSLAEVRVRYEEPDDAPAIRRVTEAAFNSPVEAKIVDALKAAGIVTISLVAVIGADEIPAGGGEDVCARLSTWGSEGQGWDASGDAGGRACEDSDSAPGRVVGGEVIGHVMVTPVTLTTDRGEERLLGLGPVAALPEHQGRGVGTQLVETCLERLRESGFAGVVVVGSPHYYRRFGFIPGSRWGLRWNVQAPEEHFMALELSPGQLAGKAGVCRFRPEFDVATGATGA